MTMQVSKGEFDRRVKLLEQKVKESTSSLIARLQAESEAFIEKLRNTQLDIDALREEINHINPDDPEIDNIINNFVKGYNNFASNTLRINDVFDSDGQFDGSRIRPLSIETAALSVGTRSQQLDLRGIEFRVLPYTNGSNSKGYLEIVSSSHSKYHFSSDSQLQYNDGTTTTTINKDIAGYLFHYGFGTETQPRIYKINEQRINIKSEITGTTYNDQKGIYIYAKLASLTNAVFEKINNVDDVYFYSYINDLYTSTNDSSKVYKSDDNYSHYNSEIDYYVIQGDNLSNAEVDSQIKFFRKINDLYTISAVNISSISQGDEYYYFSSKIPNVLVKETTYKSGIQYYTKTKLSLPTRSGTTYYIKKQTTKINGSTTASSSSEEAVIIISHDQYITQQFNGYLTIKLGYINIGMATAKGTYERKIDMTYGQTTIDGRLITTGRIEGNNCSFDLDTGEISGAIQFSNTDISHISSSLNMSQYATTSSVNEVNGQKVVSETIYMSSASTTRPNINNVPSLPSERVTNETTTWVSGGWQNNWTKKICAGGVWYYTCVQTYKLKSDNSYISGSTKYSAIEYSDNISTSAAALTGSTTVDGGLILTRKIMCGSGSGTSALSGVGNYAFWAGHNEPASSKAYIKHNGDAYFKSVVIDNSDFKVKAEDGEMEVLYEETTYATLTWNLAGSIGLGAGGAPTYKITFYGNSSYDNSKYDYYAIVKFNRYGQSSQYTLVYLKNRSMDIYDFGSISNVGGISRIVIIRMTKISGNFNIYQNGYVISVNNSNCVSVFYCLTDNDNVNIKHYSFSTYGIKYKRRVVDMTTLTSNNYTEP